MPISKWQKSSWVKKMKLNEIVYDGRCFIIAEAGVNHNGDINLAYKMIDAAKDAGVDAIKFQTFIPEDLVTKTAGKAEYQKELTDGQESQQDMLKKLALKEADFQNLKEYAEKKDIMFLSTPFDLKSVDILEACNISAYKLPSGEITNIPLLKYVAEKGKPMIISTGMSNLDEVKEALDTINEVRDLDDVMLLHCTSNYPASVESLNLKAMKTLEQEFGLPVGYSDHTEGIEIPPIAVACGANVIEKHFTLDRNLLGPDHKASIEPNELKEMVNAIRHIETIGPNELKEIINTIPNIEIILGDGEKIAKQEELEVRDVARKSIVTAEYIPKDTAITEEMLTMKRPGTGIPSKDMKKVEGKKTTKDIEKDTLLDWDMVE